jgi:hypothetical protein
MTNEGMISISISIYLVYIALEAHHIKNSSFNMEQNFTRFTPRTSLPPVSLFFSLSVSLILPSSVVRNTARCIHRNVGEWHTFSPYPEAYVILQK